MPTKTITINRFDLGISKERRDLANGYFRYLENVAVGDEFRSIKQVPNVTSAEGTKSIKAIIEAGNEVYGLGQDADPDTTIYKCTSTEGATPAWGTITNGTATGYNPNSGAKPFFAYYGSTIYYASGGYIGTYVGTTNTPNVVAAANIQGGVVQKSMIYGWIGQSVYEFDPSDNSLTNMITIPSDQTIVDLVPMGDIMAIICTSNARSTASKCYLWDRVTTTTFLDIIDIGYGDVAGADILDGVLIAVIGFANRQGFRIKRFTGNLFTNEITYFALKNDVADYEFAYVASLVKSYTNYIYFLVRIFRPSSSYANYDELVLFRYGRTDETKQNALSVYKTIKTGTSTLGTTNDFIVAEAFDVSADIGKPDKFIIASIIDGSTYDEIATSLTSGDAVYSAQAGLIETAIYTGDASHINKKFLGFTTSCEPLPSGASIVVKGRTDANTSYTTLATLSVANTITKETMTIESTGANLPDFKEIQFRFELLGGAEMTGFKFKYEEMNNLI